MNPMPPRLTRFRPHAAAFTLLMLASGQSFAEPATYNLMLKKGGVVLECARGAFVFDKAANALPQPRHTEVFEPLPDDL